MNHRLLVGLLLALSFSLAVAQVNAGPERSVIHPVGAASGSDLSGSLFIGDFGESSVVVFTLTGTSAEDVHPSHLHVGDCGSGGGVEVPLADVDGSSGLGVTLVQVPFDELTSQDLHVNAHNSADDMGTIVACGEVGAGAEAGVGSQADASTTVDVKVSAKPAPEAAAEPVGARDAKNAGAEQDALRTESYQLFALQGSGVTGTLNVTQRVQGGTQFVVTLVGIEEGSSYQPVLFAGDCGPDRERVTALPAVGAMPNDPYTSISNVSLSFDEVADGDYFLYIYQGDEQSDPLACGEVGAGANR